MRSQTLTLAISTFLLLIPAQASIINIDFEGVVDGTDISSIYSSQGVTFNNSIVITAGISLNELEFPPHSGLNAATDNFGPITLTFSSPVSAFSGFFTYAEPLTLVGYDSQNHPLVSSASALAQNYTSSGNPTNEAIGISAPSGIDHIIITGDPGGGSFVVDDIAFDTTIVTSQTPEPSTLLCFAGGLGAVFAGFRIREKISVMKCELNA